MKYLRKITLDHNKIKEIQPFAFKVKKGISIYYIVM